MSKKKPNIPKGTELCECKGVGCNTCGGKGYRKPLADGLVSSKNKTPPVMFGRRERIG